MTDSVWYEWVIERIIVHDKVDEDGERIWDIEDNNFGDKLTNYYGDEVLDAIEKSQLTEADLVHHKYSVNDFVYTRLGLLYHLGNEVDGELERDYAYLEDGKLPTHFPHGRKIPQRFHKELAAYQKRVKTLV